MNISEILDKQKERNRSIPYPSLEARKLRLSNLLNEIINSIPQITESIKSDFRKHPTESKITEIFPITTELKYVIRKLKKWMKPEKVSTPLFLLGSKSFVLNEPKGCVLIISPWNYPFLLSLYPIISAVAAGNNFILKPSEKSPQTSKVIKSIIQKVFPAEEGLVIEGGKEVSEQLLDMNFDHIFYTGGEKVGKIVMKKASEKLTPVTLELGGKSPVIICDDAKLQNSAERVAWGKFINCGQTCVAPDYILINEKYIHEFLDHLHEAIYDYYGASDFIFHNDNYCRINSESEFSRLIDVLDDAKLKGAKVLNGLSHIDSNENFMGPTVLTHVSMEMRVMNEELFGPILPIVTFKNESEIEKIVSYNPNPLAMYIFSKSKEKIRKLLNNIPSGTAAVNDVVLQISNYHLPFGGRNESGIGKGHGENGFKEFSNSKAVIKNNWFKFGGIFAPPYTNRKNTLVDLLIRKF